MNGITIPKIIAVLAVLLMVSFPAGSFARVNSLIGGLSTGYDYSPDSDEGNNMIDMKVCFFRPYVTASQVAVREIILRCRLPRDSNMSLEDYNWDWDSNVRVAADRFMTKDWQMGISNHYLVSDYFESGTNTSSNPANPSEEVIAPDRSGAVK